MNLITKNWKLLAVLTVFIWSLMTLFQIVPDSQLQEWQRLAALPPEQLQDDVLKRVKGQAGWDKMTNFEQEDAIKQGFDDALFADNIQVITKSHGYALITNLKLGWICAVAANFFCKPYQQAFWEITPEVMNGVETVINNRINSLGVSETVLQRAGKDRLLVQLPGR